MSQYQKQSTIEYQASNINLSCYSVFQSFSFSVYYYQASSRAKRDHASHDIEHPATSHALYDILHQFSSFFSVIQFIQFFSLLHVIEYRVSSIEYRVSSIEHPTYPIPPAYNVMTIDPFTYIQRPSN
jgi:hypothetical protein